MMLRIKEEFQKKHFGFCDSSPKDFYCSKWFESRILFVTYRTIIFVYCLTWTVVIRMFYDKYYPDSLAIAYLSSWVQYLQAAEMAMLLLVSIYGLYLNSSSSSTDSNDTQTRCRDGLKWFHKLSWVLFTTSNTSQFLITVVYWTAVTEDVLSMTIVFHQHAINSVLAILNLMICRMPIRILHIIYVSACGLFYSCLTLILHGLGKQSVFYIGVLDWKSIPGRSVAICLGIAFIGIPICHAASYLLYVGREKMAEKLKRNHDDEENKIAVTHSAGSELLIVGTSKESTL